MRAAFGEKVRRTRLRPRAGIASQAVGRGGRSGRVEPGAYDSRVDNLVALLPSLGVGFLFFFVMRAIVHADRREREAVRRAEVEEERLRASRDNHGQNI